MATARAAMDKSPLVKKCANRVSAEDNYWSRHMNGRSIAGCCRNLFMFLRVEQWQHLCLLGFRTCCDKNVMAPGSERVNVDQNAAELSSDKRLKNQIE